MRPFLSLVCVSLLVIAMTAEAFAFRGGGGAAFRGGGYRGGAVAGGYRGGAVAGGYRGGAVAYRGGYGGGYRGGYYGGGYRGGYGAYYGGGGLAAGAALGAVAGAAASSAYYRMARRPIAAMTPIRVCDQARIISSWAPPRSSPFASTA